MSKIGGISSFFGCWIGHASWEFPKMPDSFLVSQIAEQIWMELRKSAMKIVSDAQQIIDMMFLGSVLSPVVFLGLHCLVDQSVTEE